MEAELASTKLAPEAIEKELRLLEDDALGNLAGLRKLLRDGQTEQRRNLLELFLRGAIMFEPRGEGDKPNSANGWRYHLTAPLAVPEGLLGGGGVTPVSVPSGAILEPP